MLNTMSKIKSIIDIRDTSNVIENNYTIHSQYAKISGLPIMSRFPITIRVFESRIFAGDILVTLQTPMFNKQMSEQEWKKLYSSVRNIKFRGWDMISIFDSSYIDNCCFELTPKGTLLLNLDLNYEKLNFNYINDSITNLEFNARELRNMNKNIY